MHEHTEERTAAGQPVLQYFGKWPFVRLGAVRGSPSCDTLRPRRPPAHLHLGALEPRV